MAKPPAWMTIAYGIENGQPVMRIRVKWWHPGVWLAYFRIRWAWRRLWRGPAERQDVIDG